jgi:hypothetical protein
MRCPQGQYRQRAPKLFPSLGYTPNLPHGRH